MSASLFIRPAPMELTDGDCRLSIFLGQFAPAMLTPTLFAQHGLACPPQVQRSVHKRQAEFLAGRICAQAALQAHGLGHCEVAIGAQREPLWPAGMVGSITHNGQYAAAIACPQANMIGVGIDIETIVSADAYAAMAPMIISPAEAECMRACAWDLGEACLQTLVFSAKESFFKAAFGEVKAFFDFDAIELTAVDGAGGLLHFRCMHPLGARLPLGLACAAQFHLLDAGTVLTTVILRR